MRLYYQLDSDGEDAKMRIPSLISKMKAMGEVFLMAMGEDEADPDDVIVVVLDKEGRLVAKLLIIPRPETSNSAKTRHQIPEIRNLKAKNRRV